MQGQIDLFGKMKWSLVHVGPGDVDEKNIEVTVRANVGPEYITFSPVIRSDRRVVDLDRAAGGLPLPAYKQARKGAFGILMDKNGFLNKRFMVSERG